jgi:hypothetical protein
MPAVPDDDPIPAPPLPPPDSRFEEAVRRHPIAAVIIAALVGLLIGKGAL